MAKTDPDVTLDRSLPWVYHVTSTEGHLVAATLPKATTSDSQVIVSLTQINQCGQIIIVFVLLNKILSFFTENRFLFSYELSLVM